jgi:hypothetical protein
MKFSHIDYKSVLIEDSLREYEHQVDFFYIDQLVPLNSNIFIMGKILQFPFSLFTDPEDRIFFSLVLRNFFQAGLLTITRLATDEGKDVNTLLHFKNWVYMNIKPEYQEQYRAHLKKTRFDKEIQSLFEKARTLRDSEIAHIKRDFQIGEQDRLNFEELKRLCDSLNSVLEILSFNVGHMMVHLPYSSEVIHPMGTDNRSDIEKILDSIAKESIILNMPETGPEHWPIYRKTRSAEELEQINKYRGKFGLQSV